MRIFSKLSSKVRQIKQTEEVVREEALFSQVAVDFACQVLEEEVIQICATLRGAQRWGSEQGYVRSGLTRVGIERPRVRGPKGEVALESYQKLQNKKPYDEATRRLLLGGLATRQFEEVGEALGSRCGLSKSSVSRISKSFARDYEKLMSQSLEDIVGLMIDGIGFGDDILLIAALGVNRFGKKRLLGLWAGSTENAEVVSNLLDDLKERGLNPRLITIDGSKALRRGCDRVFSGVPIQRCQRHKRKNIADHLSRSEQVWGHRKMTEIFQAETWEEGYRKGKAFSHDLGKLNVTAQRSWDEAFPELITVLQLQDPNLRRFFSTTNPLESLFASIRTVSGRVKRWRSANQALYWTSGAYTRVEKNLRKVHGYRNLEQLEKIRQTPRQSKNQVAAETQLSRSA
jgi:transposase-like protein